MTAAVLDVDPSVYWEAAQGLDDVIVPRLVPAVDGLVAALDGADGMAGSDPGGVEWAAAYDPAARSAVAVGRQAVNACLRVRALLGRTGDNYYRAELASVPSGVGGGDTAAGWVPGAYGGLGGVAFVGSVAMPSAAGVAGGGWAPAGWSVIEHAVGCVWPNADQDRLRATGSAWRAAGDAFEASVYCSWRSVIDLYIQHSPEASTAAAVCGQLRERLCDVADTMRRLGAACDELAGHVDALHAAVEHELVSFAWQSAAIEGTGVVLTLVSVGISDAAAQAAEGTRIAAIAARVTSLIEDFIAAARALAASLPSISAAAEAAAASLGRILGLEPALAGVETVPALRMAMDARRSASRSEQLGMGWTRSQEADAQLTGLKISRGHAFAKHVVRNGEFPGVSTPDEFARRIAEVVRHGERRDLDGGRTAFWWKGIVVLKNSRAVDGGTAFRPTSGYRYFAGLQ